MDQSSILSVETRVGKLLVVSSGTLHVTQASTLLLTFGGLEMEFVFRQDDQQPRYVHDVQGNRLIWNLYNFINPSGQGILAPLRIGTVSERELYASLYVWTPNPTDGLRIISYVLYQGDPVAKPEPAKTEPAKT